MYEKQKKTDFFINQLLCNIIKSMPEKIKNKEKETEKVEKFAISSVSFFIL